MMQLIGEFIGTFILVLLGNGVVASNLLNKTKAHNSGWVTIPLGWGLALFIAVHISSSFGPAHLNPAVSIAMATIGNLEWAQVPVFICAQFLGAMVASIAVYLHFYPHWEETEDSNTILGTFATGPAVQHTLSNFIAEALGTAVLVFSILSIGSNVSNSGLAPLFVGMTLMAIAFSLGSTTGAALNPARDLGPRIMHAILPIPNKDNSDWVYSWIPVVAPIAGAIIAALIYQSL